MRRAVFGVVTAGVVMTAVAAAGQTPQPTTAASSTQRARYQMGTMESVLQRAVEHAASVTRERLRAVIPVRMLPSEATRVRGFRLDGWGVFFDVMVPNLEGALTWSYVTLNQNDLGLETAMRDLRSLVEKTGDTDLRQAFDRIELQVGPRRVTAASTAEPRATAPGRPAALTPVPPARAAAADPILNDPEGAWRTEVINALMDAMLEHSRGLDVAPDEWLSVGARRDEGSRPGLAGAEAPTIQIRINGADLRGFWAGQMTRDEARTRINVQVF